MILSLKVENFRSIKDEVEFSMYANSNKYLADHLIEINNRFIVKTAGLYGPNASGKSNLLKAFEAIINMIEFSCYFKEESEIKFYDPFLLSTETKEAATKFEIEFVANNLKYIYKIEYDRVQIRFESLDCFFSKLPSNIFTRDESGWENIKFGASYKGSNKKIPFFKNNAYLSKIGSMASASDTIKDAYNFFTYTLQYLRLGVRLNFAGLNGQKEKNDFVKKTGDFLSLVDTGINTIIIKEQDISNISLPEDIPEEIKEIILFNSQHKFMFSHSTDDGDDILLDKEEESDGTKRLFELTPILLSSFTNHRVFIIDEIDHNIHPHLAALILRLFNDSEVNKFGSQLIFTTHNIDLMTPNRMRRDQIWFSEKENGATTLFTLDDFEKDIVKASSPFNKWYNEGRFGGTPKLDFIKIKDYFLSLQSELNESRQNLIK